MGTVLPSVQASAPPTSPQPPQEAELLLSLVHERDIDCPRCGYNLRNLTQPVCPECREHLVLKVGALKLRLHWLLLALAPGMFCAIAMFIFGTMCIRMGPPRGMPIEGVLTILFMCTSGVVTATLAVRYRSFLRLRYGTQQAAALVTWLVHVGVFAIMVARM